MLQKKVIQCEPFTCIGNINLRETVNGWLIKMAEYDSFEFISSDQEITSTQNGVQIILVIFFKLDPEDLKKYIKT